MKEDNNDRFESSFFTYPETCAVCKRPCHFGTGRFVNRCGYSDDHIEDGWLCGECVAAHEDNFTEHKKEDTQC